MTDKERLMAILRNPIYPHLDVDPIEALADYLLDMGVTVPKKGHWMVRITSEEIWAECSECRVCGSPQWKVCPVCETRMVKDSG